MNVQAFISPANIATGLISVDARLRFSDGTKQVLHIKIPVNFSNPLKPQIATFASNRATTAGHTLTHIVWPDLSVTVL